MSVFRHHSRCRERIQHSDVIVKWVDSDQMLADGMTKPSAMHACMQKLSMQRINLCFDPMFTSAKKKRKQAVLYETSEAQK
jgi:5,10-methylene-tetrahydrofolate dehydrogenase/methenyl tetrahydrofolate cyclohydrolase